MQKEIGACYIAMYVVNVTAGEPDDYVLATGKTMLVFIEKAFSVKGINIGGKG